MILGVIADDFTGATDVASMLVRAGLRTVQVVGVPQHAAPQADAVVVALKSRTAPVADAVQESLAAWRWLRAAGARQCYFKYCSTFDSTPQGNIGPVAEALMAETGSDFTIACPALPENGRSVYRGHLFVGDQLLSDSSMRHHPLTPMTDANLVRVLQAQVEGKVGLVREDVVNRGSSAITAQLATLRAEGVRFAVVDATHNDHLHVLAEVCADMPLVTAGSGLALGLPAAYAARGWVKPDATAAALPRVGGRAAVLSGSCSSATQAQVAHWLAEGRPAFCIDPLHLAAEQPVAKEALAWAAGFAADIPVLVYATATSANVLETQRTLGADRAGHLVEQCLGRIATGLVAAGVRRLVVAGGETSGAVVQALGVRQLRIGASIDPGVPWTQADESLIQLALKSGNFGGVDFFSKALRLSEGAES